MQGGWIGRDRTTLEISAVALSRSCSLARIAIGVFVREYEAVSSGRCWYAACSFLLERIDALNVQERYLAATFRLQAPLQRLELEPQTLAWSRSTRHYVLSYILT